MVMKKYSAWRKNNIREIKHTWERYIAIVAIIILGVGFYAGLRITKDAMVTTLDTYLNQYNMYDYRLLSTLGFDKEDAKYFSSLEGIEASEGGITIDFIADMGDDRDLVIKAHSIGDTINQIQLLYGRLPSNSKEILVDSAYFLAEDLNKTIIVSGKNEKETIESFATNEYTIVGIVKSSNYLSQQRGTTKLASGTINGFAYIPEDGFIMDYYTEIYLKLEESGVSYSKEYENLISNKKDVIKEALDHRAQLRYDEIIDEANEKISEAEEKYQEAYDEYLDEKLKVNEDLDNAYEKLNNAKKEIEEKEQLLLDGEEKLQDGWKEYEDGLKEYNDSLAEFESLKASTLKTFDKKQKEITENRNKVKAGIKEIKDSNLLNQYQELTQGILSLEKAKLEIEKSGVLENYAKLQEILKQLEDSEDDNSKEIAEIQKSIKKIEDSNILNQYQELSQRILSLEKNKLEIEDSGVLENYSNLQDSLIQLEAGQKELDNGINAANLEFEKGKKQLDQGKRELDRAKEQLLLSEKDIQEAKLALKKGKSEYETGLSEYKEGRQEAEDKFAEAEKELENAKKEIEDGKKEIEDIKTPTTYVFNRSHNTGYNSFENDSSIIEGIAKILPIFFFLVAALVCSTTMARMVDEQRTQIGTLKSLGYSNRKITNKYMFYSGSAAILGWIIGYLLGSKLFPMAIWAAYGMLYSFAPIEYIFDTKIAITSLIASLLSSAGITYLTCKNELIKMPAQLIRPKAPKAGKRTFLEKIPFIWERIGFLHKVTIRNIFRYKKRLFMTILGVAGCTALIIAALGIKDSVSNIADDQFDKIMTYDYEIYFTEEQKQEDQKNIKEKYSHLLSENVFVVKETWELEVNNQTKTFQAIATNDPNISNIINFSLDGNKVSYPEDGKVLINDKLAKEANVSIGDTLTIKLSDTDTVDALIGGIFENYVDNYMFMTENTYQMIFNENAEYKNAFASSNDKDMEKITQMLGDEKEVAAISVLNNIRNMVSDMMQSLNYIIWLVIACAAALAFLVIYNLNNINITERTREIATIKVLGFYSIETYSYVYRENIVLTSLGILLGLGLGIILHKFIMAQLIVDLVSFKEQIFPLSYILAIIITFLLTIVVNLILKRKIDSINMAESLKSVE